MDRSPLRRWPCRRKALRTFDRSACRLASAPVRLLSHARLRADRAPPGPVGRSVCARAARLVLGISVGGTLGHRMIGGGKSETNSACRTPARWLYKCAGHAYELARGRTSRLYRKRHSPTSELSSSLGPGFFRCRSGVHRPRGGRGLGPKRPRPSCLHVLAQRRHVGSPDPPLQFMCAGWCSHSSRARIIGRDWWAPVPPIARQFWCARVAHRLVAR